MIKARHDYFYLQIALAHHGVFLKMVEDLREAVGQDIPGQFQEEVEMLGSRDASSEEIEAELEEWHARPYFMTLTAARKAGVTTIVFSAMCLEALINEYGAIRTSNNYYSRYLDTLPSVSKWIIVPQVVAGESISTDGQAFELISQLFNYRNRLVHPKSKEYDSLHEKEDGSLIYEVAETLAQAPSSIKAIREAAKALYKIDPDFEYLEDYKPFWDEEARKNQGDVVPRQYFIDTMMHKWPTEK